MSLPQFLQDMYRQAEEKEAGRGGKPAAQLPGYLPYHNRLSWDTLCLQQGGGTNSTIGGPADGGKNSRTSRRGSGGSSSGALVPVHGSCPPRRTLGRLRQLAVVRRSHLAPQLGEYCFHAIIGGGGGISMPIWPVAHVRAPPPSQGTAGEVGMQARGGASGGYSALPAHVSNAPHLAACPPPIITPVPPVPAGKHSKDARVNHAVGSHAVQVDAALEPDAGRLREAEEARAWLVRGWTGSVWTAAGKVGVTEAAVAKVAAKSCMH